MTVAWDLASGRQYVQRHAGGMAVRKALSTSSSSSLAPTVNFPAASIPPASTEPDPNGGGSFLSRAFNTNVMIMIAVVLFAILVVIILSTIARCRIMRRLRMQQQLHPAEYQQQQQQQWQRHKGLKKDQIEALPVITFGSVQLPVEGDGIINDCVVCLTDYQKGDKVRLLPLCKHFFHDSCIDTWLSTHTSCPVCRHSVLQEQEEQQQPTTTDDHHTTAGSGAPEADHRQSQDSQEDDGGASSTAQQQQQRGIMNQRATSSLGRNSSARRFGWSVMRFGRARVVSATTTTTQPQQQQQQQHMEIEVEPGRGRLGESVAGGASSSDQSARHWSFSRMARLSTSALGYTRR